MKRYQYRPIADLSTELCAGLARLKRGYIDSAESLTEMLNDEIEYPYDFVVFRITGYRPPASGDMPAMVGRLLKDDLKTLILELCNSFPLLTSAYSEPIYDLPAAVSRFNVSSKTIQRWMRRGLVARRLVYPDGRRRLAFLEGSIERFIGRHSKRVRQSAAFSKMTSQERADIIRRARRLGAIRGAPLVEVCRRISRKINRSVETIRQVIRTHDIQNPSEAIFKDATSMPDPVKTQIYMQFIQGASATKLAKEHDKSRNSIYRIVNQARAQRLASLRIDYIYNPQFDFDDAKEVILGPALALESPDETAPASGKDLPPYLRELYAVPLLTAQQERDLFRRYNYLKYLAHRLRDKIDMQSPSAGEINEVESLLVRANMVKNRIIRANLRLVVSIAKRHVTGPMTLFELVSDGNVSLMKAVERFDFARGHRFSTYASWAIMRNFAHTVPKEKHLMDRFATGIDDIVEIASALDKYDSDTFSVWDLRESINTVLDTLTPIERSILIDHFGLDSDGSVKTLEQLGRSLGLSKERVRQIELKALGKMRQILPPE